MQSPERHSLVKTAIAFISVGIAFFAISISFLIPHPFWYGAFNLLAGAFLTTGIFSILLGLSDFMNYVTTRLREIVVDHTYLKTLSRAQKLEFKKNIDEEIFGEGAVRIPGSLYHFIDQRLTEFYKSSYRCEFHDMYYFSNSDHEEYWLVENHSSYILYRNQEETVDIEWIFSNILSREILPFAEQLLYFKVAVDNEILEYIKDSENKTTNPSENNLTVLPNENNKYIKKHFNIFIEPDQYGEDQIIDFTFSFDVPNEMFDDNKESVVVEFRTKVLFDKSDNNIGLRMTHPTKDMMLSCEFKDGLNKMECFAFGFNPRVAKTRREINSAFIDIKEWILPGHGAVINWLPIDKNASHG